MTTTSALTTGGSHRGIDQLFTHDPAQYREAASTSFVPLNIAVPSDTSFAGGLRHLEVGGVHINDLRFTPHSVERTKELINVQDPPYYKLSLVVQGGVTLHQEGRSAQTSAGDLVLCETDRPYQLDVHGRHARMAILMFPKELLELPQLTGATLTAVTVRGTSGLGRIVSAYLRQLVDDLDQVCTSAGHRLVGCAIDLVEALLTEEIVGTDRAVSRQAELTQKAIAYIDGHLGDADLAPSTVAAGLFISQRQMHRVFALQGLTVAGYIRTARLKNCRRDLADPILADLTVAELAAKWGFSDAAHFSRTFKAQYGCAPSALRQGQGLEPTAA